MTGCFRTIGVFLALAVASLTSPLVHLGHTHDGACCALQATHSCRHGHHCHSGGGKGATVAGDEATPAHDHDRPPVDDRDCPLCQTLAMPALAASACVLQAGSQRVERPLPAAIAEPVQTIELAFYQRGPPAA